MSTLDDAYEAAALAIYEMTRGAQLPGVVNGIQANHVGARPLAEQTINAFLAHLADNPPEEMVEAARSIEGWEQGPRRTADGLSAALRSIVGVKTDA